jgi:hypothetical protein
MPYPIGNGNIVAVTFEGLLEGQQVMSTLHFRFDSFGPVPNGGAELDELAAVIKGAGGLFSKWLACVSRDTLERNIAVQLIAPDRFVRRVYVWTQPNGQAGTDAFSSNTSIALTKRGQAANRSNIGAVHMPGVPLSFVTGGLLNNAGVIGYTQLCGALVAPQGTTNGNFVPVIFHKAQPLDSEQVLTCDPQLNVRVQRRRTVGVGA